MAYQRLSLYLFGNTFSYPLAIRWAHYPEWIQPGLSVNGLGMAEVFKAVKAVVAPHAAISFLLPGVHLRLYMNTSLSL